MKPNILVFASLLFAGCAGNPGSHSSNSQIDGDSNVVLDITEPIKAEDQIIERIVESVKVIPLETNSESVISDIWKIAVGNQSIFVGDAGKNALVFGLDGRLIKHLPYGQGPGEYIGAYRIKYLPHDDCFFLLDNFQDKILKYDGLGNYITHYPAMAFCSDFFPIDGGFLYFQDAEQNDAKEFKVFATDSLLEKCKEWTLGPGVMNGSINSNFHLVEGEVAFAIPYSNQIYTYKDGEITKRYNIVFDGMEEIDYSQRPEASEVSKKFPESYFLPHGALEGRNYLLLDLKCENQIPKSIFYSKRSGKYFSRNICCLPDSFLSWISIIIEVSGSDGESFIGIVDPASLLNEEKYLDYGWDFSNPGNLISDADMEKLKSLKPDDNPVIVLFKFKSEI